MGYLERIRRKYYPIQRNKPNFTHTNIEKPPRSWERQYLLPHACTVDAPWAELGAASAPPEHHGSHDNIVVAAGSRWCRLEDGGGRDLRSRSLLRKRSQIKHHVKPDKTGEHKPHMLPTRPRLANSRWWEPEPGSTKTHRHHVYSTG